MIVAIAPVAASGYTEVLQFSESDSVANAITEFCNAVSPPLNPADYEGVEVPSVPAKADNQYWVFNHDTDTIEVHLSWTLAGAMENRSEEIDAKTDELIAQGFEYPGASGNYHSLSDHAQLRMLEDNVRMASLSFPQYRPWLNDGGYTELANSTALQAFIDDGLAKVAERVDSGVTIKLQIYGCATIAAVEAVVDPR